MAETESDLDPQGPTNDHNFLMTVQQMRRACNHVAEMLLIIINLLANCLIEVKS